MAQSLVSIVLPTSCSLCGGEVLGLDSLGICRACWSSLTPWAGAICAQCGLPLVSSLPEDSAGFRCGPCRAEGFDFDLARVYGLYRGNLRGVILQLKFRRRERLARRLGRLLAMAWLSNPEIREGVNPLVVPVPLHPSRERERGFNQSRLLAQGLVRSLRASSAVKHIALDHRALVRTRATIPQTGLSLSARRENVKGVFAVERPGLVQKRWIVLVDDVMTTGATLSACAAALKAAGALQVFALAAARATPQFPDTPPPAEPESWLSRDGEKLAS